MAPRLDNCHEGHICNEQTDYQSIPLTAVAHETFYINMNLKLNLVAQASEL